MVRRAGPPPSPLLSARMMSSCVPKPGGAGVGERASTGRSPGMRSLGRRGSGVEDEDAGVGEGRRHGGGVIQRSGDYGVAGAAAWRSGSRSGSGAATKRNAGGAGAAAWRGGSGSGSGAATKRSAGGAGVASWRGADGARSSMRRWRCGRRPPTRMA
ncbi:hypothetical protein PAHAL_3G301000 [Panicum hallii]|uniref:Uncharacterized protein n=1 Tax=Panicum hallii TaxID=206008 RepID=A0A2T8KJX0_9POAL|nr:hypothetical protein PAHAL_3G301000 [Panicum hallii]